MDLEGDNFVHGHFPCQDALENRVEPPFSLDAPVLSGFCDFCHHFHDFYRIAPDCGFFREHYRIRAVQDGVGNVRRFGPGGADVIGHGYQHLGGRDHRDPEEFGFVNEFFLNCRHLLDRDFHPEVSPGNHQGIGFFQDPVYVLDRLPAFDLGNDVDGFSPVCRKVPDLPYVLGFFHERDAEGVQSFLKGKLHDFKVSLRHGVHEYLRPG